MNKPFRKKFTAVKLSPEEASRQGSAARLAWEHLPAPGAAIAFLNSHHDGLDGRPIDVAVRSAEGLKAVREAILAHAA
ncbi:hypothetical protein [Sphingosinicella sp. BN140058]|uniref:hypothetical protein n=1 Tax=Sphingosinicella sp. BN140058 TaxID=1892855 RepID=UPI001011E571|nr:hypothetical protein [Sphingosinicella sp. BN140058]QAY76278.1 hypothetical protein ETR14_06855 [Sphingosinicella sp. BN140058]